jgi:hypothetical protein
MHNVMIDSHPIDNWSNIKCCVSFLSNRDDIPCLLDDGRQYWDSQVESLGYHILQSVKVYVGDLFFKVILLATSEGHSTTFGLRYGSYDTIWKDNQGTSHQKSPH